MRCYAPNVLATPIPRGGIPRFHSLFEEFKFLRDKVAINSNTKWMGQRVLP